MNQKFTPKLSKDKITVEYDEEDFEKSLPHLASELKVERIKIPINGIENTILNPGAIDFIQRCSTNKEAHEIIDFLENRNEISKEKAKNLRNQLENLGLPSFGTKREPGYYERKFKRPSLKKYPNMDNWRSATEDQ